MGSADPQTVNAYVDELILAGCSELAAGRRQEAHNCWRRAAALRPTDEEIWLALLSVVDTDADRRACLENVTTLNPQNSIARQQLRALDSLMTIMDGERVAEAKTPRSGPRQRWPLLVWAFSALLKLLFVVVAVTVVVGLGVLIGIIFNLV